MTKSIIASTTEGDIPALQDVLDQTGLFPSEFLPDMLAGIFAGEAAQFCLTCHLKGRAVGFCYVAAEELTDGTWNMRALAVHPDVQGHRCGTAIAKSAEDHLRSKGQRILIVETSGTDAFSGARRFYVRNGYQEEARIRDFWAHGDDKVIFRKAL